MIKQLVTIASPADDEYDNDDPGQMYKDNQRHKKEAQQNKAKAATRLAAAKKELKDTAISLYGTKQVNKVTASKETSGTVIVVHLKDITLWELQHPVEVYCEKQGMDKADIKLRGALTKEAPESQWASITFPIKEGILKEAEINWNPRKVPTITATLT